MREIDNNLNNVNFTSIQRPMAEEAPKADATAAPVEQKEITDLKNVPAAELGKSQVATDSVETDMKFLEKHPQLVKELNEAVDNYAKNHSEEETLQMIENMHKEFATK